MELFGKYLGRPENWKRTVKRVLRGKKVCRNCWRFPFACNHLDKEVWEALTKRIEEDRLGIRPLPRRKARILEEENNE